MARHYEKFKRVSRGNTGFAQAICSKCSATFEISDQRGMPAEQMAKKFRDIGWSMGTRRAADVCPKCVAAKDQNTGDAGSSNVTELVTAGAPADPSREDKRRIRMALEDHYIGDDVGYAGAMSDGALARQLCVPRAWVTSIREDFFGENAGCEADASSIAEARALIADIKSLRDQMLDRAADLDAQASKLCAGLERAERRTGAAG